MNRMSFGMKFAFFLSTVALGYLFAATFAPMTPSGAEQAKTISPFMLATILTTLVQFYFGKKHENKTAEYQSLLEEKAKIAAAKLEEERIAAAKVEAEQQEKIRLEAAKTTADKLIAETKTETTNP